MAFCVMGPWNLAGGLLIFRFDYCVRLQVRRYAEDGNSIFLRSAGPICWTTSCHKSEGRRLKFCSHEERRNLNRHFEIICAVRFDYMQPRNGRTTCTIVVSLVTITVCVAGNNVSNQLTF